jgi:hypothetical protein
MFFSFTVSSSPCGNATRGSATPLLVLAWAGAVVRVIVIVLPVVLLV